MSNDTKDESKDGISGFQDAAELLAEFDKIFEISDKVEKANATTYTITMEPPSRVVARHGEWRMRESNTKKRALADSKSAKNVRMDKKLNGDEQCKHSHSENIYNRATPRRPESEAGLIKTNGVRTLHHAAETMASGGSRRIENEGSKTDDSPKSNGAETGPSRESAAAGGISTTGNSTRTVSRKLQELYAELDIDNVVTVHSSSGYDFLKLAKEQEWRSKHEMSWPITFQEDKATTSTEEQNPQKAAINVVELVRKSIIEDQQHLKSPMLDTNSQHFITANSEKVTETKGDAISRRPATVIRVTPMSGSQQDTACDDRYVKKEDGESPRSINDSDDDSQENIVSIKRPKTSSIKRLIRAISGVFTGCWRKPGNKRRQ